MTATKIRPVQATAPERIFLQGGPQLPAGIKFSNLSEVTWCRDDADGAGIPYVRADLAGTTPAGPVAGYRISDPSDPEIGFWFSETPCAEGYMSEPLYAGAAPAAVAPEHPPMPETWAVVASIEGQDVVCISSSALSGKGELTESEEQAVIGMAQHLLAFVGYGLPPCKFDPDDEPAAAPALEAPAATAADEEPPLCCDICGQTCADPWHYSTATSRHMHACDVCYGASHAAPAAPKGWKLVPVEPTEEMGLAYLAAARLHAADGAEDKMRFSWGGYRAALAAAPQAPAAPSFDRSVAQAVQSLQKMWDDLEKSGGPRAHARTMRRYSDALSTVERALAGATEPVEQAVPVTPPVIDAKAMKEAFDGATAEGKSFNDALIAAACATIWMRPKRADGAPDAMAAYMTDIATQCALHAQERHDYLPNNASQAANWRPHFWVIQAMSRAISFDRMMNPAAPAAPAVDAGTLRDAEHYRFIKRHRLILSGGTQKFGWPIAPFGDECDRYIAQELAAERAAQAAAKGEHGHG